VIVGDRRPREIEHPVEVRADHLVFGRRRRHPRQPLELTFGNLCHALRQMSRTDAAAKLLDLGLLAFAELVLNRFQLLAQVVLPLRVGHLQPGHADAVVEDVGRERIRDPPREGAGGQIHGGREAEAVTELGG